MIDFHSFRPTIRSIGREDRAMLGSNPSARTDGGTSAGASALNRCSCSQEFQMMFCPKSDKPMPHENYKISKNHNERCAIWQYLQGWAPHLPLTRGCARSARSTPGYYIYTPLGRRNSTYGSSRNAEHYRAEQLLSVFSFQFSAGRSRSATGN
jgi:hypothetical protein